MDHRLEGEFRNVMRAMSRILVVGSIALDSIRTPHGQVKDVLGGSAVYFAWAASYFSDVGIVGPVGDDFPKEHIEVLKARSIGIEGLENTGGDTFRWIGRYGENPNERETLFVSENVFENFHPQLPQEYCYSDYVFLANIDPELHLDILSQLKKAQLVAGDTMDIWIEKKRAALIKTLKRIDVMILNDSEARMLTDQNNLLDAARIIRSLGPKIVVVKRGENGALLVGDKILFSVPAYPVENVIDPTGAGDVFAGGFVGFLARAGLINEENLRKAVVYGSMIASFCVEDFSLNRLKSVTEEDIIERIQEFRHLCKF